MMKTGFREVAHTADWEIEAWAEDLPGLLIQAARGMYALSGVHLGTQGRRARRVLALTAADPELLLVRFLNELLNFAERERLAFDDLDLQINEDAAGKGLVFGARLQGRKIAAQEKEIKAVTFHNLAVRQSQNGLTVNVVFDV